MITHQTSKCIVCLKDTKVLTGNIVKDGKKILAGFCEKHSDTPCFNFSGKLGCYGGWIKEYGYEKIEKG